MLDLSDRIEIGTDPLEQTHPELLVSHFTPAEPQGDLGFVTFVEEPHEIADLDVVVAVIGSGSELDFLDLDDLLLELGFVRLFLFLILELA